MKNLSSGFLKERYFVVLQPFSIFVPIYLEVLLLKRVFCIGTLLCLLLSACPKVQAASIPDPYDASLLSADSIMKKVIFFAPFMKVLSTTIEPIFILREK